MSAPETTTTAAILELLVRNHPGVMSHVCGLFARRAYNVEGIVCLPLGEGRESKIFLKVNEEERLDQVIKQIVKLSDVKRVERCNGNHRIFDDISSYFAG